jgi:hypothetical protein
MASRAFKQMMMRYRAVALAVFILIALLGFVFPRPVSMNAGLSVETDSPERPQTKGRRGTRAAEGAQRVDYAKFSHRTREHQQACDLCHKFPSPNWKEARKESDAFPDITEYPQHPSCLKCHYQQFFARERPAPKICAVCHTSVAPRNSARFPFPSLNEAFQASKRGQDFTSDFIVNFPHETHMDVIEAYRPVFKTDRSVSFVPASFNRESGTQEQKSAPQKKENCSVCHQTYQPQGDSTEEYVTKPPKNLSDAFWLKKGTFKTTPANHATCFTCHSQETGIAPAPSDCNACHKLPTPEQAATQPQVAHLDFEPSLPAIMGITDRTMLNKWRRRDSSATFRHEGGAHPDQSCADCHHVAAMNTLDQKTLRVPIQSCGVCHITATTDDGGALNFELDQRKANPAFQCTKCHLSFGKEPVPKSHLEAVAGAASAK